MISCLHFVPRGAAAEVPLQCEPTAAEISLLKGMKGVAVNSEDKNIQQGKYGEISMDCGEEKEISNNNEEIPLANTKEEFMKQLNMDEYDNEEDSNATLWLAGEELTVFNSNSEDPYITVPDEDDHSEEEDNNIRDNDCLILVGKTVNEQSIMEVNLYDETSGNLYVHHDFYLPSFPLCLTWMDQTKTSDTTTKGNYIAVGTFLPGIEIWDVDMLDAMEPVSVLGGYRNKNIKKKKSKKKLKLKPGSHTDAVMSLAWSSIHRNRLASGSADSTIKLWDITTEQCRKTYDYHSSKVQALEWNPAESSVLLSGAYDKSVIVTDIRSPKNAMKCSVEADVECCKWNAHNPATFFTSTESGSVTYHDVRKITEHIFYLSAHNQACTGLSVNSVATILATSSTDKSVKIWNYANQTPSLLCSREDMKVGELFTVGFEGQTGNPFLVATGGSHQKLALWDISQNQTVIDAYELHQKSTSASQASSSASSSTSSSAS